LLPNGQLCCDFRLAIDSYWRSNDFGWHRPQLLDHFRFRYLIQKTSKRIIKHDQNQTFYSHFAFSSATIT